MNADVTFTEVESDSAHTCWIQRFSFSTLIYSLTLAVTVHICQRLRTIKDAPAHQRHAGECSLVTFEERHRLDPMMKRLHVFIKLTRRVSLTAQRSSDLMWGEYDITYVCHQALFLSPILAFCKRLRWSDGLLDAGALWSGPQKHKMRHTQTDRQRQPPVFTLILPLPSFINTERRISDLGSFSIFPWRAQTGPPPPPPPPSCEPQLADRQSFVDVFAVNILYLLPGCTSFLNKARCRPSLPAGGGLPLFCD